MAEEAPDIPEPEVTPETESPPKPVLPSRKGNLVIGLTGPVGSGCSTMVSRLSKILLSVSDKAAPVNFRCYKISDEILEELEPNRDKWPAFKKSPLYREKLQNHGNKRRKETRDYWVQKIVMRMDSDGVENGPVVIDGIRNTYEVEAFRRIYHSFYLVAICSDTEERWARIGEDKYQGNAVQFRIDDDRDRGEDFTWGQSVQKCVNIADYVFANTDRLFFTEPIRGALTPDQGRVDIRFDAQIDDFLPCIIESEGRYPTPKELQMAAAYALSDASSCYKRHVGAVITITDREREFQISTGYNDTAAGTERCRDGGLCFKDNYVDNWFRGQNNLHCPRCGQEYTEGQVDRESICECGDQYRDWFFPTRGMEVCRAIHAEERAILSLKGRSALNGTLYVTTFPCFQCARLVLDAGVKKVVYVEAYPGRQSKALLEENGCTVTPFTGFTARAFFRVFPRVS